MRMDMTFSLSSHVHAVVGYSFASPPILIPLVP